MAKKKKTVKEVKFFVPSKGKTLTEKEVIKLSKKQ